MPQEGQGKKTKRSNMKKEYTIKDPKKSKEFTDNIIKELNKKGSLLNKMASTGIMLTSPDWPTNKGEKNAK